ncbi:MAG: Mur ligase family protein [Coriobacteriia bacterium]|nr:Mur ligase family protein [Coriobacteriia bacterium]
MAPVRALTYSEALGLLESALTFGINPSLDGIRTLTAALARPQEAFRSIQVTGTNGKTSVTRIISALLSAHGERTGTYTSPHLVSYTERMAIDGVPMAEDEFAAALSTVAAVVEDTIAGHAETLGVGSDSLDIAFTEFELLTAAALWFFRERACSWACLEVGMGGRWDATSVVSPQVAVVTGVGLDHTDRLGVTREEIAADKAHIIKPGSIAVIGPGCTGVEQVLLDRSCAVGAPVVRVGQTAADVTWRDVGVPDVPGGITRLTVDGVFDSYVDLAVRAPSYQVPNVATAIAAVEVALGRVLDRDALASALRGMCFPGRFQVIRQKPPLIVDGAHNPEAALVLADAVREAFGSIRPVFVLGVMGDKDAAGIVRTLAPVARGFVCTASRSDRALPVDVLADVVRSEGAEVLGTSPGVVGAVAAAEESSFQGVVVAGSIYVAGELLAAGIGNR